jgi:phosphopantetheinyl transferase
VEYNISHDGEYVLLGVKRGGDVDVGVGVDIMSFPPNPDEIEEALTDQVSITFLHIICNV